MIVFVQIEWRTCEFCYILAEIQKFESNFSVGKSKTNKIQITRKKKRERERKSTIILNILFRVFSPKQNVINLL